MDTKEKNRSGSKKRTSANRSRRSTPTSQNRKRPAQAPESDTRRRNASAQNKNARPVQNAQQRRRGEEKPARRSNPVRSNAPEQVFKPGQEPVKTRRDPQAAKRSAQRRQSAKRAQEREIQKQKQQNRPAVEYTPPKPVNVNRLLLQIVVVLAVVLAVVLGLSVFFKVETVVVYGNRAYSAWTVQEAAGIEGGENLMTLNRTRASGKIIASLPYVESARIGIKLPDTVNIYIEEIDVAYAISSENGAWWLMTSSGRVLEQTDAGTASSYTKILGIELKNPEVGKQAVASEHVTVSEETTAEDTAGTTASTEESMPYEVKVVTGQDRLNAALTICASLELNQVIGEAANVDVSDTENLMLYYGSQYEVLLGDSSNMDYKIGCMKAAIAQQKDYEMGTLDVSFTVWPDQVGFTPADTEE